MTLATLRNLVWYWVDDQDGIQTGTGGYFTNTQVNAWLNRAMREVQKQLIEAEDSWYLGKAYATTTVNQAEYALPADFLSSQRLEYVISGSGVNEVVVPVVPMTLNQQDKIGKSAGTPIGYVILKDSFQLFPAPDTATTIRLYYNKTLTDMTVDADVPDVPEAYQEYIAILAAYNGYIKDDRVPTILQQKKEEYMRMMKQASQQRQMDTPKMIVQTMGDDETFIF